MDPTAAPVPVPPPAAAPPPAPAAPPPPDLSLPAETLLAAIGVVSLLEGKARARKVTNPQKEIRRLLDRFLARPERETLADLPDFDYDEAVRLLDDAGTEEHVQALGRLIKRQELRDATEHAATAIVSALQQGLPRAGRQDVLGTIAIRPREMAVARFARAWSVAADPMVVLRDLCQGSLTPDMVTAFGAFWPALYELAKAEMKDALADMRTKRPKWELEPRRDRLVRVFMGVPALNLELAADMQRMFAGAAQPAPPPPPRAPSKQEAENQLQTPGQKE